MLSLFPSCLIERSVKRLLWKTLVIPKPNRLDDGGQEETSLTALYRGLATITKY